MAESKSYSFTALKFTALLVAAYAYQVATGFDPGFNASSSPWWKFFTSIIGHSSLEHLFNNAFFLGLFGSIYERLTSGRTFLLTFFLSALVANLTAFVFFPVSTIIGASGGATGVLAALAVYRPNNVGLAMGVPLPMWAVLIVYFFINVSGLTGVTNVAYEAHLLGMIAGAAIGFTLREKPYFGDEDEEVGEWRQRIQEWEERYML